MNVGNVNGIYGQLTQRGSKHSCVLGSHRIAYERAICDSNLDRVLIAQDGE